MLTALILAVGLVLVLEGLMPFVSPSAWRRTFTKVLALSDGQLRFVGLMSVVAGAALLVVALV